MRHLDLTYTATRKVDLRYKEKSKYQKYKENYEYLNTPEHKQYMKEYLAEYRKETGVDIDCPCGSTIKGTSIYAHMKSNKHIAYLQK